MDSALSSITIQQIQIFLAVAEQEGFARASGCLHMTQSAVSKSVARLERELGIVLFSRTTRDIHLTAAGKSLYQDWSVQLQELNNGYVKALSCQNQENLILRIGLMNTARPEWYFWQIEEEFQKKHPEIELSMASAYMTDLEEDLEDGSYDLIMIPDFERYRIGDRSMKWKWAACSPMCAMMSIHHPLAERKELTIRDILYEDFAILEQKHRQTYLEDLTERMAPYHVVPNVVSTYRNAYEIKYLFRRKEKAILLMDYFFDYPNSEELVRIPVTDQVAGVICAWNPNNQKPQVQKFIQELHPIERAPHSSQE